MLEPMFSVKIEEKTQTHGTFVYEPFNMSFGNSMGNAMRRTLLSSLPGAAIGYVKFGQAPHLFATITGVKESALDIVLNMKQMRLKATGEGPFTLKLNVKGAQKVYAKDFEGDVDVVNGDLYICEVTDAKAKLDIEAIVETGYGYAGADDKESQASYIAVDSSFSPITKVNFKVEEARVGRKTDYERLILEVWTDGSIAPDEAVKQAGAILTSHFAAIVEGKELPAAGSEPVKVLTKEESNPKAYETIIDELNLPSRVINALLRENIETVADLVDRGREDLTNLKGVGKKSIDLIVDELVKMDVELK
ncbi:DNA-directed RNA polymerase subunit alpha [Candidatus Woesebacteria bacterium]|nr:DNA-directed RNA polymerase subunit alpha [Candidatus Woesebacteria bacterium]